MNNHQHVVGYGCVAMVAAAVIACSGSDTASSTEAFGGTCDAPLTSIDGVTAFGNGPTLYACDGSWEWGARWECVELAQRYMNLHFGINPPSWGVNANGMCATHPAGLTTHYKGDGYGPVHGDLMVFNEGTFGHVAIVDSVAGANVSVVEQNASATGRSTYGLGTEMCFVHANDNSAVATPDCAQRSGWNCGDDGVINGNPNTNYDCEYGKSTPLQTEVCAYGCKIMPNGVADVCNGPPAPDCSHRSGWNCGNDGVINGNADTNYYCDYGTVAPVEAVVCTYGCVVMPNGTPDHCQAK